MLGEGMQASGARCPPPAPRSGTMPLQREVTAVVVALMRCSLCQLPLWFGPDTPGVYHAQKRSRDPPKRKGS
jgi:hypothetical protein